MRQCRKCKEKYSKHLFSQHEAICDFCIDEKDLKPNKELRVIAHTRGQRFNKLGITQAQFDAMYIAQAGKCAICGTHQSDQKRSMSIDHDHKTMIVRGLLCNNCNTGIGLLKDDSEVLEKAAQYLRKSEAKRDNRSDSDSRN